jgi:hypothetical protein
MRQHALPLTHEAPPRIGDALPRRVGAIRKEAAVAQEMLAQGLEAAVLLPKRGDEVLLEEVGAGGEGDGVGDGVAQLVRVRLDEINGLEDGGGRGCVEELDEGFDGGDGLGEVWVGGEEVSICCYDARIKLGGVDVVEEENVLKICPRWLDCGSWLLGG